jgi:signal transduction histidine kinase
MSSHLSVADAFAGLPDSHRASREAELLAANEALALAALSAQALEQAAVEALRRQTMAMALAAHELRNPLMPIRTVAVLLGQANHLDELPRLSAIIERQVMHMSRVIDDLMDAARMATGKLHLDRRRFDLRDVFEHVVDVCKPAMEVRRQQFTVAIPEHALMVDGDVVRLAQVFTNILNNAAKYTPEGGRIVLTCEGDSRLEGAAALTITIADNGIGITPEALPQIFEPFVQDPLAIGFSNAGLGIGLTLVRELVQAHAGTVRAASAGAGLGSQFVVVLPLA